MCHFKKYMIKHYLHIKCFMLYLRFITKTDKTINRCQPNPILVSLGANLVISLLFCNYRLCTVPTFTHFRTGWLRLHVPIFIEVRFKNNYFGNYIINNLTTFFGIKLSTNFFCNKFAILNESQNHFLSFF